MSELTKTFLFILAAAALTTAAVMIDPDVRSPEVFSDEGELFFPDFTDPQAPRAIEVIEYDEETATATPLKVEFRDSQWLLPSHNDYPADAETRLADTAGALVELRKDIFVSDRVEDHAEFGVIDPLDDTAALQGRGNRVTLRGRSGEPLADFIIGKAVEGKPGYRYLRIPGERRVYAVKTDADISSRFEDWIETDLLKINTIDLRRIVIQPYSVETDRAGRPAIQPGDELVLTRNEDNDWEFEGEEPQGEPVRELERALDQLRIVDVRRKPEILTEDLKTKGKVEPTMQAAQALIQRGFYLGGDGQIYGAEGELIVDAKNGLRYTLRFGDVAQTPTPEEDEEEEQGENRYVFIAVDFSEERAEEYEGSGGEELAEELSDRFADWYYVIAGADFDDLRPTAEELYKEPEPEEEETEPEVSTEESAPPAAVEPTPEPPAGDDTGLRPRRRREERSEPAPTPPQQPTTVQEPESVSPRPGEEPPANQDAPEAEAGSRPASEEPSLRPRERRERRTTPSPSDDDPQPQPPPEGRERP